ncbi:2327_t:CDS:2 [Paraglomus brasilianum]|uniref:2327_t:CDS:1 n=1 Tax=Paraglomus brasilianum TaxID=144538 RepID=A0A9N9HB94_9GLOM|nr:2327_t:CDS:2 [Paraglomus brasilianum]
MSVVCRDLLCLLNSEKNCDVLLCVGEEGHTKEFKAHSLILCARSTYFAAAFGEEWVKKEDNKYILNKPNVTPTTMDFILRYLYGGVVDFASQRASVVFDVLMATDELELLELLNDVQQYIIEKKDEFLSDNPVKILGKIWLHEAFIPLHDLDLPEVFIWRRLLEWGIAQNVELTSTSDISSWTKDDFVNLEKTLHQCLRHIRYHNFQPQEFHDIVMPYKKLLPKDVRDDIIRYHMVPEKNTSQWKPRTGTKDHSIKIDSLIMKDLQIDLISLWIDTNKYFAHKRFRYELLLRGTRDGFHNPKFHNLCDNKGPTLIVCKPSSGNAIIGGYNPLDWISSSGTYGNTDRSFLFHIKDIDDLNSAAHTPCIVILHMVHVLAEHQTYLQTVLIGHQALVIIPI